MEMDLIGRYDTQDQSGGNLKVLKFVGEDENKQPIYEDDRPVLKYYKKHDGKFLTAFEPGY